MLTLARAQLCKLLRKSWALLAVSSCPRSWWDCLDKNHFRLWGFQKWSAKISRKKMTKHVQSKINREHWQLDTSHFVLTHYSLKHYVHLLTACITLRQTNELAQIEVSSAAASVEPGKEILRIAALVLLRQQLFVFSVRLHLSVCVYSVTCWSSNS